MGTVEITTTAALAFFKVHLWWTDVHVSLARIGADAFAIRSQSPYAFVLCRSAGLACWKPEEKEEEEEEEEEEGLFKANAVN